MDYLANLRLNFSQQGENDGDSYSTSIKKPHFSSSNHIGKAKTQNFVNLLQITQIEVKEGHDGRATKTMMKAQIVSRLAVVATTTFGEGPVWAKIEPDFQFSFF